MEKRSGIPIVGSTTWTSCTLDRATGQLYVSGGNPAPDFAIGPREGENQDSRSIVVLDAEAGTYTVMRHRKESRHHD